MTSKKIQSVPGTTSAKKQKQPWWRWLITVAAISLFFYIIYQSRDDFLLTMRTASPSLALAGLALLFVSRQAVSARWHALLQISEKPVSYWDSLKLTYAGLFATNFLPTSIGGDLVRFIGTVQLGMDSALVLASLIMDRVVGLVGMSFFVPPGLYLVNRVIQAEPAIATMAFSLNGLIASFGKLWRKFLALVQKTIQDILFWLKHPRNLLLSLFFTLIHEMLLFGMVWFFLRSVDENVPYWVIASIYSLSYLATLIPLSIGGLGIQEMSITYLFSHFGGITVQSALALAVLIRLSFVINSLPGAFFLPSILREQKKGNAKN
jgi:glycosyltransferase 2 family protein